MNSKMNFCKENIIAMALFLLCYIPAIMLADSGYEKIGSALILISAAGSYIIFLMSEKCFSSLRGLLCLSWEGGLALAILRLSALHTEWTIQSKISFAIFPCAFLLTSAIGLNRKYDKKEENVDLSKTLSYLIYVTAIVSLVFFVAEAVILGYVPAFSKDTHAYNYFHVTGLHYFTVSSMMTHALTVIWILSVKKAKVHLDKKTKLLVISSNILSAAQAILCISKFQFVLIVALPVIIIMTERQVKSLKSLPWKKICLISSVIICSLGAMIIAFTALRHYEPGYLQEIFEFKKSDTPVAIQYPYMYVANNYANFNCLTENLEGFSYGIKQLFPVFALTGIKFIIPNEVVMPLYVVKEEINTLTIIYDAYYDFGIIGVTGFGLILGIVASWLLGRVRNSSNPIWLLFYAQIAVYFSLSFFSAWFSVPTTWFWFGLTLIYALVVWSKGRRKHDKT